LSQEGCAINRENLYENERQWLPVAHWLQLP
jgi:hypothetical protein